MPWQRMVADVGLELNSDGTPAYREVVVTVPRQSGKTTLILAWEIQRALGVWGPRFEAQRIAYSAQTGKDSRDKLINDQFPLLEPRKKLFGIRQLNRGMGNEGILWLNGSRLVVMAGTAESGHGKTLDLGIKDEYFADEDDRRDQALIPAMNTRPFAQSVTASTMGTDRSIPLNALVEKGRAAVNSGRSDGLAYFEWSADPEADFESPDVWAGCMPALGHTITERVVRHAFERLPTAEFMRAFCNIPTSSDRGSAWPADVWASVQRDDVRPSGRIVVGVDANPERTAASIAVAGGGVLALVTDPRGRRLPVQFGDLGPQAIRLARKFDCVVALDPSGPAAPILPELEQAGVDVLKVSGASMGAACGALHTAVTERSVTVLRHPDLSAAAVGARQQNRADAWIWARRDASTDVSPLVAVTLAWWAAQQAVEPVFAGGFADLDDY